MMTALRALALVVLALLPVAKVIAAPGDAPLRAFVSIPPQQYLLERIGGALVDAGVMLQAGHAPETYDPTPSQLARLAGARAYFAIGVPFERAWLPEIGRQNPGLEIVPCCAQFVPVHSDDHGDPHVWMDPLQFLHAAELMHETLVRLDPANSALYDGNFRHLGAELAALHRELQALLAHRRIDAFVISHGALGPLAHALGLTQIALESGGRELGPRALAGVTDQARRLGIRTVLVQKQHARGSALALAGELGAVVVEVDPLAADYPDNMRAIGRVLAATTR